MFLPFDQHISKFIVSILLPLFVLIGDYWREKKIYSAFLKFSSAVQAQTLTTDTKDQFIWNISPSGRYSEKSVYEPFFAGKVESPHWRAIWDGWAPANCKIFAWLATANHCSTADRLERRGLDHSDVCPLCNQEPETISPPHRICLCSGDLA